MDCRHERKRAGIRRASQKKRIEAYDSAAWKSFALRALRVLIERSTSPPILRSLRASREGPSTNSPLDSLERLAYNRPWYS